MTKVSWIGEDGLQHEMSIESASQELKELFDRMPGGVEEYDACVQEWRRHSESLQAQIDSLMLEYCPSEMSKEQFDNWAKHQVPHNGKESLKKI